MLYESFTKDLDFGSCQLVSVTEEIQIARRERECWGLILKLLQFFNYFPIKYISLDLILAHKDFQMFLGFKIFIPSAPISPHILQRSQSGLPRW